MSNTTVLHFFHEATYTLTYLLFNKNTKAGMLIDCVTDFDYPSGKLSYESAHQVLKAITDNEIDLKYIIETHIHADHVTAAKFFKDQFPNAKVGISENIEIVEKTFSTIYNIHNFKEYLSFFDFRFENNKIYELDSEISFKTFHTPGHTPACSCILVDNKHLFTGDTLFMPDFGTGRCDFPNGSAKKLFHSIHEILYKLDDDVIFYVGHDYQPGGRELLFSQTIGYSKQNNLHLKESSSMEEFVKFRETRDATLNVPKLLFPSIQLNLRGGDLPPAEENGSSYIKIPVQ